MEDLNKLIKDLSTERELGVNDSELAKFTQAYGDYLESLEMHETEEQPKYGFLVSVLTGSLIVTGQYLGKTEDGLFKIANPRIKLVVSSRNASFTTPLEDKKFYNDTEGTKTNTVTVSPVMYWVLEEETKENMSLILQNNFRKDDRD